MPPLHREPPSRKDTGIHTNTHTHTKQLAWEAAESSPVLRALPWPLAGGDTRRAKVAQHTIFQKLPTLAMATTREGSERVREGALLLEFLYYDYYCIIPDFSFAFRWIPQGALREGRERFFLRVDRSVKCATPSPTAHKRGGWVN